MKKLTLNRETLRQLSDQESRMIEGAGIIFGTAHTVALNCASSLCNTVVCFTHGCVSRNFC